jgi:hypothetical protein
MKYACLIYGDGDPVDSLPHNELENVIAQALAYTEDLRQKGHFLGGEALEPVQTATTIRRRNGKLSMTDGPFAETKEHLAGFFLVEAGDLNDAIRIASTHPSACWDAIEIRPVRELRLSS